MAYLALAGRIILLGVERLIVKGLGNDGDNVDGVFVFFGLGALFLLPFAIDESPGDYTFILFALSSGLLYSLANIFYFKSLNIGEISLVTPIGNLNIFFLFILSVIFLHERFTSFKLLGIILIFYGTSTLKREGNFLKSLRAIINDRSCLYMLVYSFLVASGRIIDKSAGNRVSPMLYSFSVYVFVALIMFIYLMLNGRLKDIPLLIRNKPLYSIASGFTNAFTYLFLLIAIRTIEVSVAEPLSMLSTIVSVALGAFILKENVESRMMGVILTIAGGWLILL
ncbi:MAG: GRP family sugar transporter [Thermoanaerobacteraceae bacterium]|nr:GRP family sugar transporter [Thermoanaerobacteraceae bacterium]